MKTKFNHQERDARIRRMHNAGLRQKQIGLEFGICAQGVQAVLKKLAVEEDAIKRSAELRMEFPLVDDLGKKWKVDFMLDALHLSTRARTSIAKWCEWNKVTEISLREFMDFVISELAHARPGFLITPLLEFRNIGLDAFWSTVKRLTEADLGPRCNMEWKRRLALLKQASRIAGGSPLSWSKPCNVPDWLRDKEPEP